jgi:hypothetical protein
VGSFANSLHSQHQGVLIDIKSNFKAKTEGFRQKHCPSERKRGNSNMALAEYRESEGGFRLIATINFA